MKQIIAILILALILSGCATATIHESILADGTWECEASFTSGFKNFQDVSMKACSAKGGAKASDAEQAMNLIGQAMIKSLVTQ